ncbi:carboxyl transferase domain-containing protein [Streptomyces lasalocidi]
MPRWCRSTTARAPGSRRASAPWLGYGGIFQRNTKASGVIPQISVMLGPCAGGAAYSPALTDFVFMVRETSQMFITGPDVVKAVTGEEISQNGLGGADVHAETSGVCHFAYDDEETCIAEVRYLLSMLPQNNRENPRAPSPPTRSTAAATSCWTWSRRTATGRTT